MSISPKALSEPVATESVIELIIESIEDVKGLNIVKIDLKSLDDAPTDYFIICEGESSTQIKSISDRIYRNLKDTFDLLPSHYEGQSSAKWICIDYFDTVVHVFYPETRRFYDLEELWSDGQFTDYHTV